MKMHRRRRAVSHQEQWRPMIEDNGLGFFVKHRHVTPHIGTKGKLRFLPETDRDDRVAPDPGYDPNRESEAERVVEAMRGLNDIKKVEIETFDSKLGTTNMVIAAFLPKCAMEFNDMSPLKSSTSGVHCSYERMVHFVITLINSEYDAAIMVWKEKVRHNLVRPTTVIKRWNKREITTWSPYKKESKFRARDFEAYRRVMPHSEYPSGSACMCQTLSDSTQGYLAKLDCREPSADASTLVSVSMQITSQAPFPAGNSSVEPGLTPVESTCLTYPSSIELAKACSQSRLDGGMHFEAAVSNGETLCSSIGDLGVEWAYGLIAT